MVKEHSQRAFAGSLEASAMSLRGTWPSSSTSDSCTLKPLCLSQTYHTYKHSMMYLKCICKRYAAHIFYLSVPISHDWSLFSVLSFFFTCCFILLFSRVGMFWNCFCGWVCWNKWMPLNFPVCVCCMFLCLDTMSLHITLMASPTLCIVIWRASGLCVSMWLHAVCMLEEGIGEVMEKEDCIQALSGQIFMGMVSSQYQARLDIVRLIDGLVNACIRFVYFSLEDELKSKVSCLCWPLNLYVLAVELEGLAPRLTWFTSLRGPEGTYAPIWHWSAVLFVWIATLNSSACSPLGVCWEDGSWNWLELSHIFNTQWRCAWIWDPSFQSQPCWLSAWWPTSGWENST